MNNYQFFKQEQNHRHQGGGIRNERVNERKRKALLRQCFFHALRKKNARIYHNYSYLSNYV